MTGTSNLSSSISTLLAKSSVTLADCNSSEEVGSRFVKPTSCLTLSSVQYVPQFPFNLLSVSKLTKSLNCLVTFFPYGCVSQDLKSKRIGGVMRRMGFIILILLSCSTSVASQTGVSPLQWHYHLGHLSLKSLKSFQHLGSSFQSFVSLECEACQLGKHHRVFFVPRETNRRAKPFALVHTDIWSLYKHKSTLGFSYFVIFVDDYLRMTWLFFNEKLI